MLDFNCFHYKEFVIFKSLYEKGHHFANCFYSIKVYYGYSESLFISSGKLVNDGVRFKKQLRNDNDSVCKAVHDGTGKSDEFPKTFSDDLSQLIFDGAILL